MSAPSGPSDPSWQQQQPPMPQQGPPGAGVPQPNWTGAAPAPVEPREVTTSFWLWIASTVLGVIGAVVAFTQIGAITDQVVSASGGEGDVASTAVTVGVVVGGVFALVIVALQLLFAFLMRRGRNWARIVLTVFGAIGVVSALAGLASSGTTQINGQLIETRSPVSTVLSVVQAVLIVVAIVMFFRPAANAYFARR